MKKSIIPIILLGLFACKERKITEYQVPNPATNAFAARYPNSSNVEWEQGKQKGQMVYEAEFKVNGKKIAAQFDANGNFIKQERM